MLIQAETKRTHTGGTAEPSGPGGKAGPGGPGGWELQFSGAKRFHTLRSSKKMTCWFICEFAKPNSEKILITVINVFFIDPSERRGLTEGVA